jgi:hypothetical protein
VCVCVCVWKNIYCDENNWKFLSVIIYVTIAVERVTPDTLTRRWFWIFYRVCLFFASNEGTLQPIEQILLISSSVFCSLLCLKSLIKKFNDLKSRNIYRDTCISRRPVQKSFFSREQITKNLYFVAQIFVFLCSIKTTNYDSSQYYVTATSDISVCHKVVFLWQFRY